MSNNKWSEQKIDELLSQVPKIQDTRSKDEVFNRLQQDARLSNLKPKKRKVWVPTAVGAAAILTLTILGATYLNSPQQAFDQMSKADEAPRSEEKMEAADASISETNESDSEGVANFKTSATEEESATETETMIAEVKQADLRMALYENDLQDQTAFRIGLSGDQANSVPVTIVISNQTIKEDFSDKTPTQLEMYQTYAPQIDETAIGFSEYHPYKGEFTTDGDSLIHILPPNHDYDWAPGTSTVYFTSLRDTFDEYTEIRFQNEDGSTVEFDQAGEPSKPMALSKGKNQQNYYLFTQADGKEFLTPNFGQSYETITEALEAMKEKPNDIYDTLIPRGINYEVKQEKDFVRIVFAEPLDLEAMDPKIAMHLIEGLLLTGASFEQNILLDNVVQSQWQGFDFTKPLPKPIGPNKMNLQSS